MRKRCLCGGLTTTLSTALSAALCTAVLLCGMTAPAAAAGVPILAKEYTFNGDTLTSADDDTRFELPVLYAGQSLPDMSLRLTNASQEPVIFELTGIGLPYGNDAALIYLNALNVRVQFEGDTVYNQAYVHIADADTGLKIKTESLQPGETRDITVSISCDFAYQGDDPAAVSQQIRWTFTAITGKDAQTQVVSQPRLIPRWVEIVCITAGILVIVTAAAGVARAFWKKTQKKKSADRGMPLGKI